MGEQMPNIRIFLSSPGDVKEERDLLESVVDELDQRYKLSFKVRLDLVRYETFAPDMDSAQDIVNRNIGDLSEYDIFVGIMWRRFGTPTGSGRFDSGTEEEFAKAYEAKKQNQNLSILFYFSEEPVPWSNLTSEEVQQLSKVIAFRESLKSKGLIRTYPSREKFASLVREDLSQKVDECLQKMGLWPVVAKKQVDPEAPPPSVIEVIEETGFSAFVAQVPNDLQYSRLELIDELTSNDVKVYGPSGDAESTKKLMAKAHVCIHLFDGSYDQKADEQLGLSCSCAQSQILWISGEVKENDPDPYKKKLLALNEREGKLSFIHSYAPSPDIIDEVKKLKSAWSGATNHGIFLTFHEVDKEYVKDLFEYLRSKKIKAVLDRHDFVEPGMNAFHEVTSESNAVIVCYGQVADKWVQQRLSTVVNFRMSRNRPLDILSVYLAPPPPEDKRDRIKLPSYLRPIWINSTGGFNPSSLQELFSHLGPESRL